MTDLSKYRFEIDHIISDLEDLERGNFCEDSKTSYPSAKTIAKNIKRQFIELMEKILEDKPGAYEIINNKHEK